MRNKKKRKVPVTLLLTVVNRCLVVFGLYVIFAQHIATLPVIQKLGVHYAVKGFLSNWNLHWVVK